MRIRSATNQDIPRIREIVFGVLTEFQLEPDPNHVVQDLSNIEAHYIEPGGLFDLLVDDGECIVGTVGLCPLGQGIAELRKMYLVPEARGRGQGRKLLEHVLQRARALGFHRVELETANNLSDAIRLYTGFGFRPIERAKLSACCHRAYAIDGFQA